MATRAIKPKRDDTGIRKFPSLPERAPSILRQDQPTPGRVIALIGLLLVAMGALGMLAPAMGLRYIIGPGWGEFWLTIGIGGLLYHAFNESDLQFRRTYGALGLVLVVIGVLLRFLPQGGVMGGLFLAYGVRCLILGLPFLLSFARHETDEALRYRVKVLVGSLGVVMALLGFAVGSFNQAFLLREGVIHVLMGLIYFSSFIGMEGASSTRGFYAGLALGAVGGIFALLAFVRSMQSTTFLVPDGMLIMGGGLIYLFVALCICVDWPFMVLLRRELTSFFLSPVAYLVILGFVLVGWWKFYGFLVEILERRVLQEPIIGQYLFALEPVMFLLFAIPILTMRLLSEEQRTGTWEVLMTAPVKESTVVLSKFFAVLIFFMAGTATWGANLIALRTMGQEAFDYRPILTFFLTLACTGGGFLAIGLFFSSLTRNQIIAAVLTFATMLVMTSFWHFSQILPAPWNNLLRYASYLSLWLDSLRGVISPRHLLLFVSISVFFLFLTVKVLESRKWK